MTGSPHLARNVCPDRANPALLMLPWVVERA